MRLFLSSIGAKRDNTVEFNAILLTAPNWEVAEEITQHQAQKDYPASQGFSGHSVRVKLIECQEVEQLLADFDSDRRGNRDNTPGD